jgi:hypothetical protein
MSLKKGDLVVPVPYEVLTPQKSVGVVLEVGRQEDGKTHRILWVDTDGCFQQWHYENGIKLYIHEPEGE